MENNNIQSGYYLVSNDGKKYTNEPLTVNNVIQNGLSVKETSKVGELEVYNKAGQPVARLFADKAAAEQFRDHKVMKQEGDNKKIPFGHPDHPLSSQAAYDRFQQRPEIQERNMRMNEFDASRSIMPPLENRLIERFHIKEQDTHTNIRTKEQALVENIQAFEYYKGYAAGMNGLIERVQNKESLQNVIGEVQMLGDALSLHLKKGGYTPMYPNNHETPDFLKGQINGIVDGVKTLRDIDITKYVEMPLGWAQKAAEKKVGKSLEMSM